jgi:hypothetical protein
MALESMVTKCDLMLHNGTTVKRFSIRKDIRSNEPAFFSNPAASPPCVQVLAPKKKEIAQDEGIASFSIFLHI